MKVWPIDPLVPRHLRLEVPEKLPQGLTVKIIVPGQSYQLGLVSSLLYGTGSYEATHLDAGNSR